LSGSLASGPGSFELFGLVYALEPSLALPDDDRAQRRPVQGEREQCRDEAETKQDGREDERSRCDRVLDEQG
jgi:hypothetical protein